jgi:hypothetical protein
MYFLWLVVSYKKEGIAAVLFETAHVNLAMVLFHATFATTDKE